MTLESHLTGKYPILRHYSRNYERKCFIRLATELLWSYLVIIYQDKNSFELGITGEEYMIRVSLQILFIVQKNQCDQCDL